MTVCQNIQARKNRLHQVRQYSVLKQAGSYVDSEAGTEVVQEKHRYWYHSRNNYRREMSSDPMNYARSQPLRLSKHN